MNTFGFGLTTVDWSEGLPQDLVKSCTLMSCEGPQSCRAVGALVEEIHEVEVKMLELGEVDLVGS